MKNIPYSKEQLMSANTKLMEKNRELQAENETLSSALHDARHEIRILKNKIGG